MQAHVKRAASAGPRLLIVATDIDLRGRLAGLLQAAGYGVDFAEPPSRAHLRSTRGFALALVVPDGLGDQSESIVRGLEARIGEVLLLDTSGKLPAALHPSDEKAILDHIGIRLRPAADTETALPILCFGDFALDLAGALLLRGNGDEVKLTAGEFRLLRAFVERPRRVLAREQLIQYTRGPDYDTDRGIDMLLVRLRRKIEVDPKNPLLIVTVPGSGYKFTLAVEKRDALTRLPVTQENLPPPHPPVRRRVSMLCAELVPLAGGGLPADPEMLAALVAAHRARIGEIAVRYGGVAGRGFACSVPVTFGFPSVREHASEAAVEAALAMATPAPGDGDFAVRIGVASGLVIANADGDIIGEAPGNAWALQSQAAPGQILIGAELRRAIGGLFRCSAVPTGVAAPCWQVLGRSAVQNRFRALRNDPIPFVGRVEELAFLKRRWAGACEGEGRLVWLMGEAGIGKSRLARAFAAAPGAGEALRLSVDCAPHQAQTALYPLINLFERLAPKPQAGAGESWDEKRLARLRHRLRAAAPSDEEMRALADLLDPHNAADDNPQARKTRLFITLLALLTRLAERRPILLLCEDLHWADSLSLDLLERFCRDLAELPVLLIVTSRPEFQPVWASAPVATTLALNRLARREAAALAANVAAGRHLPAEIANQILARTEGVPLFVEEFTRTVLETGAAAQAIERFRLGVPLDVPATLHDSLTSRLDRLGWARDLAQMAAALDCDFSPAMLAAVAGLPAEKLAEGLAVLTGAQLLTRDGDADIFRFRHALLRDAAYSNVPVAARPGLHARIADVLRQDFAAFAEANPAILAQHLAASGQAAPAIALWREAGQRNVRASANLEAVTQFRAALALLEAQPANAARDALELDMRVEFSVALSFTSGYTSRPFHDNTVRALAICEALDAAEAGGAEARSDRVHPVLWGMVAGAFSAGDVQAARIWADRFLRDATRRGDRKLRMIGHRLAGMALFGAGLLDEARSNLEEALALYDPKCDPLLATSYGFDQRVASLGYLGRLLQDLGFCDQALIAAEQALAEACAQGHANTMLYAHSCRLLLHLARRDHFAIAACVREMGRLARQHESHSYQIEIICLEHILKLRAPSGKQMLRGAPPLAEISRNLEALRELNWIYLVTRLSLYAAETAAETGHVVQARLWYEEARGLVERLEQRGCLPELFRVRAAVMRAEGAAPGEVEAVLGLALAASREQSARWLEFCANYALAHLLCAADRHAEAMDVLGNALQLCPEATRVPVFGDARALLDSLAPAP